MDTLLNYTTMSRAELLQLVAQQQVVIAEQQAVTVELQRVVEGLQLRITGLEEQLNRKNGGGTGMPGNKPADTRRTERKAEPPPRRPGVGRERLAPTEVVQHAVDVCPDCGIVLQGGWVQWTREVLELPLAPVQAVEHRFMARECPRCGKRRVPAADLSQVAVGKQRFGVGVVSLIATLREAGRLPIATIQWLLETVYHLHLSRGGISEVLAGGARQAAPAVAAIRDQVRASPVVHGDETGWRENGKNGYVWTFSTPTERYFVRRGRGKVVVDEVLGPDFQGVLVSDFYAAYDHYAGQHQRCWAHLLREIHDLRRAYPDDTSLKTWAQAVRSVFDRGKVVTGAAKVRRQAHRRLTAALAAACRPFCEDALAVQAKLCRRMLKYLPELLTFVQHPAVPADNNPAERSLRHLVIHRKISGGTRSSQGTITTMTLASLFGTWRARGLNPFLACRQLLTSPHF